MTTCSRSASTTWRRTSAGASARKRRERRRSAPRGAPSSALEADRRADRRGAVMITTSLQSRTSSIWTSAPRPRGGPWSRPRQVWKSFGKLDVLKGVDSQVQPQQTFVLLGPVGRRQVDAAALHQPPREDRRRPPVRGRRAHGLPRRGAASARDCSDARGRAPARRDRHGVPAVQPVPAHDRAGERHGGAGARAARAAQAGRSARPRTCWRASASPTSRTPTPRSSRAASSSAWPSPARWP